MSVAPAEHQGPWTIDDVLALPEDARSRIELVGGSLVMSPSPGIPHQRASRRLAALLEQPPMPRLRPWKSWRPSTWWCPTGC
ncbi:hypothetical protein ACH4GP_19095 [Streptomyces celluloflavus]|uniref:Restriction endonuclease domain-containing protein n=1 Tax=Streptomyces celluloflavus TaxID=58344 RepID=A0ABW7REK9_9ACTN